MEVSSEAAGRSRTGQQVSEPGKKRPLVRRFRWSARVRSLLACLLLAWSLLLLLLLLVLVLVPLLVLDTSCCVAASCFLLPASCFLPPALTTRLLLAYFCQRASGLWCM
jgi:hypothetical protein